MTGRELLRARLSRRGLAPVLAATAVLGPTTLRADVPSTLVDAASRAAAAVKPLALGLPQLIALAALVVFAAGGIAVLGAGRVPPEPAPSPRPSMTAALGATEAIPLPRGVVVRFGSAHFRVPERIYSSALSPDGKLIAIGGSPPRVYEAATWRPIHELEATGNEDSYGAENLVFSPDGRFLGGANTQFAYLWDVRTGALVGRIDGGKMWRWTQYCAFTPDGRFVLSDEEKLSFYDPATARKAKSMPGGRTVALSPDGKVFARMTNYDRIRDEEATNLWFGDLATGKELFRLDGFAMNRTRPVFAPDGRSLALISPEGTEIVVWDTQKKSPRLTLRTTGAISGFGYGDSDVGFTSDGKTVFTRLRSGDVIRWDAGTGRELPRLRCESGPQLRRLHALPDGKTLLTTSILGWVRVWDSATGEERPIPGRYWEAVLALAPDGKTVAVGDRTGRIDLLDATTGKHLRTIREKGIPVRRLVFGRDGTRLAVGEAHHEMDREKQNSHARLLRVSDGVEVWSRRKDEDKEVWLLIPLGFASDDKLILAHYPKDARIWDMNTDRVVRHLESHNFSALSSSDGKLLATDDHGEILLFDLVTGRESKRILVDPEEKQKKRSRGASLFAWSGDGRKLATTLPQDYACILEPATGRQIARFPLYTGDVPESLKSLWRNHDYSVRGLALSPDGKRLAASALGGKYVAIWDTETGNELTRLDHDFQVDSVAFMPDGKSVVSFGSTGLGYRWDLDKVIAARKK